MVAASTRMEQCDHLSGESRRVKNLTAIRESTESQESLGKLVRETVYC